MRVPVIPDWCKGLPDTTILYSCDIGEFFGYPTHPRGITRYIKAGLLPEPGLARKLKGLKKCTKHQWLLGDIRKLRVKMLEENKQ